MKLLQFNWVHPIKSVEALRVSTKDVDAFTAKQYSKWLIENGFGMTDVFTNVFDSENIEVDNLFFSDYYFLEKFAKEVSLSFTDSKIICSYLFGLGIKNLYTFFTLESVKNYHVNNLKIIKYIIKSNADCLLLREPSGIDYNILAYVKKNSKCKIIGLIGCEFKHIIHFKPTFYDAVFTITSEYLSFFKERLSSSFLFKYGCFNFSKSFILKYEIVFVGDLDSVVQERKAILMNEVAAKYDFKWWGPRNVDSQIYGALYKAYQGVAAGNQMLEIYASSKIVLNDYPANANGAAVNMRIWEVISSGSFLLTRDANNLQALKEDGGLVVFDSNETCLQKLDIYLNNDMLRKDVIEKLRKYCYLNFNMENSVRSISNFLLN